MYSTHLIRHGGTKLAPALWRFERTDRRHHAGGPALQV
jgi:hypothetical protein